MLQIRCAGCGRILPVIHDRSQIMACPWCATDLRAASPGSTVEDNGFYRWSAVQIGEIIAHSQRWQEATGWKSGNAFRLLCSSNGLNSAASFARFLGTSKLTTWYWLTDRARPSLGSTLDVYHRFGVSLVDHIFGRDCRVLPPKSGISQYEAHLGPVRRPRQIDWEEVKRKLMAELAVPLRQAPSFIGVAARLGIARRTLRAHEPALCRKLSARWRQRRKAEACSRDLLLKQEISSTLIRLSAVGADSAPSNIEADLNRPGLFNRQYARRVLTELLRSSEGGISG